MAGTDDVVGWVEPERLEKAQVTYDEKRNSLVEVKRLVEKVGVGSLIFLEKELLA